MKKVSVEFSNAFCPQALFLYGTYKPDGTPNFGLFCWATYCAHENGMRFVVCIGEDKLTRDRIRETGMLSASLVTENMLPAADFCGNNSGRTVDKSLVVPSERGQALPVPVPTESPWAFELQVEKTLRVDDGISEIFICRPVNTLADERLLSDELSMEEKLAAAAPVVTMNYQYVPVGRSLLGAWGDWQKL